MDQSAQARAVAEVRREIMKNVADLETVERKFRDMAGAVPTPRLEPLIKRIEAAGKAAAEIKAMFGPLDPDVVPLKLFQRGSERSRSQKSRRSFRRDPPCWW